MRPVPRQESRSNTTGVLADRHRDKPKPGREWPKVTARRQDLTWQDHAACKGQDPDLWTTNHPGPPGVHQDEAITICDSCPVQAECLAYALAERISEGIWGGLTPGQRQNRGRTR